MILPRPSQVHRVRAPVLHQSRNGPLLFTHAPDPQLVPKLFTFVYAVAVQSTGQAIMQHYAEHFRDAFEVLMPPTDAPVICRYAEPPQITWINAAVCNATVQLEEALVHE